MVEQKRSTGETPQTPKASGAEFFGGQKMKQIKVFQALAEEEKKNKNKEREKMKQIKTAKKVENKQATLFDLPAEKEDRGKVATDLMKIVASKSLDMKKAKKTFSEREIREVIRMGEEVSAPESELIVDKKALKEQYRRIKRHAKELEVGNRSRLIVFPSLVTGEGWYKMVEFSALYYVYRLADRMGRTAHIMKDSDKFSKCYYTASLRNIEKFKEQFYNFEGNEPEVTEEGILIFNLSRELTEDEVGDLKRVEETRREKLHNLLRPKAMDPATFQAILMVMRQVSPKVEKMHMQHYKTTGEQMIRDIENLLAVYFDFSCGIYDRKVAGEELIKITNRLMSALTLLSETRTWKYDAAAMVGENINEIRRLVIKNFSLKM